MYLHTLGTLAVVIASATPPIDTAPPPAPPATEYPAEAPPRDDELVEATVEERTSPVTVALQPVANGLTADQVAARVIQSSPEIEIKRVEIAKAAARLDQTMIQFFPVLSGTASYTRLSPASIDFEFPGGDGASVGALNEGPLTVGPCPGDPTGQCVLDSGGVPVGAAAIDTSAFNIEIPLNSWSLQAKLSVPLSDYVFSLIPAHKGSIAQRRAAELAHEAETVRVETDARLAYYDWVRATAAGVVAEESVKRNKLRYQDVQASFEAGAASKADVLRIGAMVANAEALVVDANAAQQLTAQHLATMMGETGAPPRYAIGEAIVGAPGDVANAESLPRLIQEGHQNRLEMRALAASGDAIGAGIQAARAQYFPRLDAFAQATYANPNQRFFPQTQEWNGSWAVGIQLGYTINQAVMARATIREYRAEHRIVELTAEQMRRGVTMEVTSAYLDRKRALSSIVLDTRRVDAAEEAYRVATDLFRVGQATTTDIIVAEANLVNSELSAINSQIDLRVANTRLRYSSGRAKPLRDDR